MARKDRVPNPPKRPQAPQRRHTPTDPAVAARRRRIILLAVGGAALVAAAIVLGAMLLSSSDANAAQALEDADCSHQTFPGQPGTHVESLTATPKPKWNSSPPTSGPHYSTPAIWGFYAEPVPLIQSVHNLEHGGIVVHYGSDVSQETIGQIRAWYDESPNGLLVSPLASLTPKNTIALSSWTAEPNEDGNGYLAKCTSFDEGAFSAFRDEHRFQGPERFPSEALLPGN
jgi:Protein of unknown function (DUF3105)